MRFLAAEQRVALMPVCNFSSTTSSLPSSSMQRSAVGVFSQHRLHLGHDARLSLQQPCGRQFHATAAVLSALPMTKEFVTERVMLVLKLYDKIDHAKLNLDADFQKDLGLDSLDHVEIVFAMEEEFYFEIPDVDTERLHTPRDFVQYVCDKEDIFDDLDASPSTVGEHH